MAEPLLAELIGTLVRHRVAAGLTQRALAAKIGTQQSAISDLERCFAEPRLSTLSRYAAAVGLTLTVTTTPNELPEATDAA